MEACEMICAVWVLKDVMGLNKTAKGEPPKMRFPRSTSHREWASLFDWDNHEITDAVSA